MPSSAKGRLAKVGGADVFDADLEVWPDVPGAGLRNVVGDYFWGAGVAEAYAPVEIPYAWVSTPLQRRPTTPINAATISATVGGRAYSTSKASVDRYGTGSASITLDTAVGADPANLATFLTTYYATPRPRHPLLRLNLYNRTDDECLRILRVGLGTRVRITDPPAGWPPGAANFVVEGIGHTAAVDSRLVDWATSALIGTAPTEPGPWFRLDVSTWSDPTDVRPF